MYKSFVDIVLLYISFAAGHLTVTDVLFWAPLTSSFIRLPKYQCTGRTFITGPYSSCWNHWRVIINNHILSHMSEVEGGLANFELQEDNSGSHLGRNIPMHLSN